MVKSRKASTKKGKTKTDYTKLKDPAAIAAAEQKYRPLDTPPGAKPFADLHTDTEYLKQRAKRRREARRKMAQAKTKKK